MRPGFRCIVVRRRAKDELIDLGKRCANGDSEWRGEAPNRLVGSLPPALVPVASGVPAPPPDEEPQAANDPPRHSRTKRWVDAASTPTRALGPSTRRGGRSAHGPRRPRRWWPVRAPSIFRGANALAI